MSEFNELPTGVRQTWPLLLRSSPGAIAVGGELDATAIPQLREALRPLVDASGNVRINCRDVTYIDSSGLHLLADTAAALATTRRVVIVDPAPVVKRAIALIGPELNIDIE